MIRNELEKARRRQQSSLLYCTLLWASGDDPLVADLRLTILSAANDTAHNQIYDITKTTRTVTRQVRFKLAPQMKPSVE